jgi:hypothetical protein
VGYYLNTGHDGFLIYPCQFITHLSKYLTLLSAFFCCLYGTSVNSLSSISLYQPVHLMMAQQDAAI